MKITQLELFKVPPRWLFLKISTDEGIFGWGEPIVEGRVDTTAACVVELEEYLLGRDPCRIEDHFQTLYRSGFYRGGPVLMSAISGIEQALWDIKGKACGLPVHAMLGGPCRDKIKVYAWVGGDKPSDSAEQGRMRVQQGFRAMKINATAAIGYIGELQEVDKAVARLVALREAVGTGVDIAIDFHGRVHKAMAKTLVHELEVCRPLFYEEPILSEHNDFLKELSHHTNVPLATGERMYGRCGFKELITAGIVDIIQPDLSHAGGILECRKIAAMAEAYDIVVAPHCPLGPIAAASCLQLDSCAPNAILQELSLQLHYNTTNDLLDYLENKDMLTVKDGYVPVPMGPGLGVTIDEPRVRHAAEKGHEWKSPVWRYEDGSVAEW